MPAGLHALGWNVEVHDDLFAPTTKDVDLLPTVAERGWMFLTQDAHIRYRSAEATALREAGLGVFVVITSNLTAERTVEILEKARAEIERVAREETPPFIWRIAKDGSVKPLS